MEKEATTKFAFTRSDWIAAFAVLVSLLALGNSVYESMWVRKGELIASKSHLSFSFSYNNEGAGFVFSNDGPGTAVIRSFSVKVDDIPQKSWLNVAKALGLKPPAKINFFVLYENSIVNPITNNIFWIEPGSASERLIKEHERVDFEVCYCSFRDECWILNDQTTDLRTDSCDNKPEILFEANMPTHSSLRIVD